MRDLDDVERGLRSYGITREDIRNLSGGRRASARVAERAEILLEHFTGADVRQLGELLAQQELSLNDDVARALVAIVARGEMGEAIRDWQIRQEYNQATGGDVRSEMDLGARVGTTIYPERPPRETAAAEPSEALRRSLIEIYGDEPPDGYHAHHIIPANEFGESMDWLRERLEDAGVGINDAENGVFLAASAKTGNPDRTQLHNSYIHAGRRKEYAYTLTARLGDKHDADLLDELRMIAREMATGRFHMLEIPYGFKTKWEPGMTAPVEHGSSLVWIDDDLTPPPSSPHGGASGEGGGGGGAATDDSHLPYDGDDPNQPHRGVAEADPDPGGVPWGVADDPSYAARDDGPAWDPNDPNSPAWDPNDPNSAAYRGDLGSGVAEADPDPGGVPWGVADDPSYAARDDGPAWDPNDPNSPAWDPNDPNSAAYRGDLGSGVAEADPDPGGVPWGVADDPSYAARDDGPAWDPNDPNSPAWDPNDPNSAAYRGDLGSGVAEADPDPGGVPWGVADDPSYAARDDGPAWDPNDPNSPAWDPNDPNSAAYRGDLGSGVAEADPDPGGVPWGVADDPSYAARDDGPAWDPNDPNSPAWDPNDPNSAAYRGDLGSGVAEADPDPGGVPWGVADDPSYAARDDGPAWDPNDPNSPAWDPNDPNSAAYRGDLGSGVAEADPDPGGVPWGVADDPSYAARDDGPAWDPNDPNSPAWDPNDPNSAAYRGDLGSGVAEADPDPGGVPWGVADDPSYAARDDGPAWDPNDPNSPAWDPNDPNSAAYRGDLGSGVAEADPDPGGVPWGVADDPSYAARDDGPAWDPNALWNQPQSDPDDPSVPWNAPLQDLDDPNAPWNQLDPSEGTLFSESPQFDADDPNAPWNQLPPEADDPNAPWNASQQDLDDPNAPWNQPQPDPYDPTSTYDPTYDPTPTYDPYDPTYDPTPTYDPYDPYNP